MILAVTSDGLLAFSGLVLTGLVTFFAWFIKQVMRLSVLAAQTTQSLAQTADALAQHDRRIELLEQQVWRHESGRYTPPKGDT